MYIKVKDSNITYPYTFDDLKRDNPNVSFPKSISEDTLGDFDVYIVQPTQKPDDYTKNIVEGTPILSGSVYVQNWNISDATEEEINIKKEEKWIEIREMRDSLLTQSDWTQFQDSPITGSKLTEWQTYRQSLRDITTQSNPFSLTWPTKPE